MPEVSVWILDKKALSDGASRAGRARGYEPFFEQQRRSCAQMLRIKASGVTARAPECAQGIEVSARRAGLLN